MVTLKEHIEIFKKLRITGKNNLIRMVWHIASEHGEEISCEDFVEAQAYKRIIQPLKTPQ